MEAAQATAVTGEGKAVTSYRLHGKHELAASLEALSLSLKNGGRGAERRIARRLPMRRPGPCMPAVGEAGNRITWNLFLLAETAWLPTRTTAISLSE